MPMNAWYKEWFSSPYYHLLYSNRNDNEALEFINRLIAYLHPAPGSKMLDVACGRGRHSKILADMGFDVTGIDISEENIEVAKEAEDDNLHFYQHDMRQPSWINYFDYAFNFFTSFGYFRTRREHDAAFRTIAQSLNSKGAFVIDYLNVHYNEDNFKRVETKRVNDTVFHISRWHDEGHFFKQIQIEENGHRLKHLYTEKVAKFSLGDFTDMLAYQGLQIQEVFGDYQLGPYDVRKSPRMIIIATRAKK